MPVDRKRIGGVEEITLNWPDKRNAMGPHEARELRLALEISTGDPNVGAVVLSAAGASFCAGGDLKEIIRLAERGSDAVRATIYEEFQGVFRAIRRSPIPIIAAVDGGAIGFGCDLCLAGSATFIGRAGYLSHGWSRVGLIPATGGTFYVAERGGAQAVWVLMAADKVDGPTAQAWRLGIACEQAGPAALEMAQSLALLPRPALRSVVELSRFVDLDAHLEKAVEIQAELLTSPDFRVRARSILTRATGPKAAPPNE